MLQVPQMSQEDVKTFLQNNKTGLDLEDGDIDKIYNQRIKGDTFLDLARDDLLSIQIPLGPAKKIVKLIKEIQGGKRTYSRLNHSNPMPLITGTGKSRNANEFHQTAISYLSEPEDTELLTKIKEAWVFHKMDLEEIIETYEPATPVLMVNKDDGLKEDSHFYQTLSNIADSAFKGIFIIPICTSTITGPVEGSLKYSHRKRVYLPVASLEPPNHRQDHGLVPVFKDDEITKILVEDCGGHGRTLEALNDCLAGRNIEECNLNTLNSELHFKLTERYRDAIFGSVEDTRPVARAMMDEVDIPNQH
ncbi:12122_t:CDS:2, partial [Acaulospora colombiana]